MEALFERPEGEPAWNGPYVDGGLEGLTDPWGGTYSLDRGEGVRLVCFGADGEVGGLEADEDVVEVLERARR